MSYILTHWRGRHPLWRAFWINGVMCRLMIYGGFLFLAGFQPVPIWLVAVVIMLDGGVLIWQAVGYFRASERNLHGLGSVLPLWGGMVALVIAVFFVIAQWWALALQTPPYMPGEPYSELRNRLYQAQYDLTVEDGVLRFQGVIALGATKRMRAALQRQPNLRQIYLNSIGGNIFEARGMARLVVDHGMSTHVDRECSSACTIVFIAGQDRHLAQGARLGFHGYALEEAKTHPSFDIAAEQERDRALFLENGVAEPFLEKMHELRPPEIWFPGRDELIAAGILSELGE
ncbi:hypothetical protein O2N63_02620 [Aliiroseovarius sp. KMU-50]|uniref:Clp protease n=1 Tax=Aliiroseovarius salicola TaxID=3009082 RepID=A0ABT4VXJ0_9RHOB|nr:hypothetical protein [Aliiroseovarius sp. KMU-50]MDA5092969.1 hypothetical protein [Aliiroseovarius sp. KMU-50]